MTDEQRVLVSVEDLEMVLDALDFYNDGVIVPVSRRLRSVLSYDSQAKKRHKSFTKERDARIAELEQALWLTQEGLGDKILPCTPGREWWNAVGCNACKKPTVRWNPFNHSVHCTRCGQTR